MLNIRKTRRPYQVLPLRVWVDLGAMAMKVHSAFPKAPALLEPTIRLYSVISRTFVGGGGMGRLTTLNRCSQCILQPKPTRLGGRTEGFYLAFQNDLRYIRLFDDWKIVFSTNNHLVANWTKILAKSAGATEYTDCISAEG